jgi:hypothetical protein
MKTTQLLLFIGIFMSISFYSFSQGDTLIPNREDGPEGRFQDDFDKTLDPALGYPPYVRLREIRTALRSGQYKSSHQCASWEERGPSNVGGRTRSLIFDPNDATGKKVWAGSVSGGLFDLPRY